MPLNARVSAPSGVEAIGYDASLSNWHTVAYGVVNFDLADVGDLALVTAGAPKAIEWYQRANATPGSDNSFVPGELSAFLIEYSSTGTSTFGLTTYDLAAELRVAINGSASQGTIAAWIWPDNLMVPGASTNTTIPYTPMLVAYEGAPITPQFYLRPGMIPGVTPADADVTWRFRLLAMPQAAFGSARIRVPAPYCVPPFIGHGASRGTHIFQGHGLAPMPLTQRLPFPRQFRTVAFDTTADSVDPQIDARIFGGPWRGHLVGASDDGSATASWNIDALLAQVADPVAIPYTPAPIVGVASAASASLNTGPESAHDGLRFTQFDDTTAGRTEILVEFGEE